MPRQPLDGVSPIDQVISTMRTSHTYVVMVSQAAADRIGINTTDLHCLNILAFSDHEPSAGELATITKLTTASITGVIDRLEFAGLVKRTSDPRDRRRVVVKLVPEIARTRVAPVFAPLLNEWQRELSTYSDSELVLILKFQQRMLAILQDQVTRLREPTAPAEAPLSIAEDLAENRESPDVSRRGDGHSSSSAAVLRT